MSKETLPKNTSEFKKKLKEELGYNHSDEFIQKNGLARGIINGIWELTLFLQILKNINKPESKYLLKSFIDRELTTGGLEDSIIGDTLYYPNRERTSLD